MTSYTFNTKTFKPVPPEKGSFPLDHDGACKKFMLNYMRCMYDNNNVMSECRQATKDYLQCRMDNELMAPEKWSKLGFPDVNEQT